jgi:cytochrome P450
LIGSVIELRRDLLGFMTNATRRYGDVVFFRFFHIPVCLLAHPDDIESVLVKNSARFVKSRDYQALAGVLGEGLLTTENDTWLRQRRLAQPAFHRESILNYARIMVDRTLRTIAGWRDGMVVNVHDEMSGLTLQIVARCLFGADVSAQAREVGEALHVVTEQFADYARLAMLLPRWFLIPGVSKMGRAVRRLDEILYAIIRERRAASVSGGSNGSGDLLSLLLHARDESGREMEDSELRDETMTLFMAGHETTALALSWTWYLLGQNPEVDEKLAAELRTSLGGREPTPADLPSLPYLDRVLKESLRLYPPAWGIGREALDDFEVGGYRLRAGTSVFISQWITHRDERFFPEPERFDPDRWKDDPIRRGALPRFAYFPFGGGPRVCIGAGFAQTEAALLLATIAQRFRMTFVPDHPITLLPSITLRPKYGIRVTIHRRD